jgi:hypothetical protein
MSTRLVLSGSIIVVLVGMAVTLAGCSSDASRSNWDTGPGNAHLRYYGGPKNGLWPDVDAKAR